MLGAAIGAFLYFRGPKNPPGDGSTGAGVVNEIPAGKKEVSNPPIRIGGGGSTTVVPPVESTGSAATSSKSVALATEGKGKAPALNSGKNIMTYLGAFGEEEVRQAEGLSCCKSPLVTSEAVATSSKSVASANVLSASSSNSVATATEGLSCCKSPLVTSDAVATDVLLVQSEKSTQALEDNTKVAVTAKEAQQARHNNLRIFELGNKVRYTYKELVLLEQTYGIREKSMENLKVCLIENLPDDTVLLENWNELMQNYAKLVGIDKNCAANVFFNEVKDSLSFIEEILVIYKEDYARHISGNDANLVGIEEYVTLLKKKTYSLAEVMKGYEALRFCSGVILRGGDVEAVERWVRVVEWVHRNHQIMLGCAYTLRGVGIPVV